MTDKYNEETTHPLIEKTVRELREVPAEELAKRFLELKSKAHRDSLTGVMNEDGVLDMFENIVRVLQNTEEELRLLHGQVVNAEDSHLIGFRGYGVWMFDLVGLHRTNENVSLGWGVGNRKLKDIAGGLPKVFKRSVDIIGRIGADEFIVLSLNAKNDNKGAGLMVDRLREVLPEDVKVNAVIGWYDKDVNPRTAIEEVREAMTKAKRSGPLDETGRSLGFGLAEAGKYVK